MIWQDALIGFGGFVFFFALIPSIVGKNKPEAFTSFLTAFFITLFTLSFASMNMWLATTSEALSALAWWILFVQKIKKERKNG